MKKIIAFLFVCVFCFSIATGCSCSSTTTSYTKDGAYWLKNRQEHGIVDVIEESEYSISVTDTKGYDVQAEITEGSYRTKLTKTKTPVEGAEEPYCYKMETTMVLKGKYIYKSEETEIDDHMKSVVYFRGYKDNLKPYKTEKHVVSTSPVSKNDKISFEKIEYEYTVEYGSKAITSFTEIASEGRDKILSTPEKATKSYNSSSFCENELLAFYPRMYIIKDGFNISLSTFSVLQNKKINLTVQAESCNKELTLNNQCKIDGNDYSITNNPVNVDCLSICQSGTYSGQKIYAYYITHTKYKTNHILIGFKSPIATVGYFEYTLKNYTNSTNG